MPITYTFHGHATHSFDFEGTSVLVDPFLNDNPQAKRSADDFSPDFILLTHGHGDHVADAMGIAERSGATIVANFEIVNWVESQGHEKTHPQHIGGAWNHPFGRVKMTPALHGSALPDGSNGGMPGGFLISANGRNIYIAGDTALFSDMALIGRAGIDLAILPIGDNFTMGPEDALEAVTLLKPKQVVPCHYGTWPYIDVDASAWVDRVNAETDAKAILMSPEDSLTL